MAQSPSTSLMTAEEVARLPDPKDGARQELVAGRVVELPPPGSAHGARAGALNLSLTSFVSETSLGRVMVESGFLLASHPDLVRGPDVSFVEARRVPDTGLPEGYFPGPPDLAVEVVSPGDVASDLNEKVAEYLAAGAQRVWTVRPRTETVTVHRPDGSALTVGRDGTLTSDDAGFAVEGFELPVARIFR